MSGSEPVVPPGHHPRPQADGRLPTIVTWLEMTKRPAAVANSEMPADTHLGLVADPSVPFYRFLYDAVGRPWLWYERRLIDDAALSAHLRSPTTELHVLYIGWEPAGFFQLDLANRAEVQLELFGLRPAYIGRGIGPWFLAQAATRAWRRGVERLVVDTNTLDHPRALALYQRIGFKVSRREHKMLRDPRILWPDVYGAP